MAFEKCIETLKAAAGRDLTDDEIDYVFSEVRKRRDYLKATRKADTLEDAALKAADELANNIKLSAVIEKRNAALNLSKRLRHVEWSQQNYGTKVAEPLETLLVGTNRAVGGARDGVAQTQNAIVKDYLSGFTADLYRDDLFPILSSGTMDREISRALWAIGRKDEADVLKTLPKEAVDIGRIIHKWEEVARVDANKEGAWIRKAAGYVVRQSHDMLRISNAGREAWMADAYRMFDIPRMLSEASDADVQSMLARLYVDFAAGNHLKPAKDEELAGAFSGPANLAKKLSQSREVFFKDADAWFDYNQKYGAANLREAVIGGLRARGEATGMMRVLGTNPEAMLQRIETELVENAKAAGDMDALKDLNNSRKELENYLHAVDGTMSIPVNGTAARVAANVRSWTTLSKLGGMIASQLSDVGVYAMSMRYNGRSFLGGMAEATAGLGRNLKTKERVDLMASLDVVMESMVGELGRMGSLNDPGSMTGAMQLFMKLNLSTWWTEKMRASAAMGLSHNLALKKQLAFGDLPDDLQRALRTYNIDEARWDMLRSLPQKLADGREYMTADQVRDLPNAMFENQLRNAGLDPNPAAIAGARDDLERSLRNYITDNVGFAVLEPDAKTRALMLQGTQPGTWTGEFMRFLMQFKSFTGAYMQKTIGRELFGRGYQGDSVIGALRNGNGEVRALVSLMAVSTLMGYASLNLKDMIKGRTPRDVSDPEIAWKVFLASMVQGGGAGIYGDFLFGEASRMGGGTLDTIAGPVVGTATTALDTWKRAVHGNEPHLGSALFKQLIDNTPYLNLFYTRILLDYLFIYRIQEELNPGYLRRMERRIEKDNAQNFLVRPSEVAR
jgi:hypothetical protein